MAETEASSTTINASNLITEDFVHTCKTVTPAEAGANVTYSSIDCNRYLSPYASERDLTMDRRLDVIKHRRALD